MLRPAAPIAAVTVAALCALAVACSQSDDTADRLAGLLPGDLLRTAALRDGACGDEGELTMVSGISAPALARLYRAVGYDLDGVRRGDAAVPKILLADLPDDLGAMAPVDRRKALFLKAVLPAVLVVDQRLLEQRRFVESVRGRVLRGATLADADRAHLARLADCYGVAENDVDELLQRVDVVPPALALAQAAIESRWGTSRFARDGNAILGQHTTSARGLAPSGIRNASFRVRSFGHLPESVAAFAHNLNTHPAYRGFRAMRARLRHDRQPLDSLALAGTLLRYSERRGDYIDEVRTIIRGNGLQPLDRARLDETDLRGI